MNHGYGSARHAGRHGGYPGHGSHHGPASGGGGHHHHHHHHSGVGGGNTHHSSSPGGGGGGFPARRQFGAARGRRPRPSDISWSSPGPPQGPVGHLGPGPGPPGHRDVFCNGGGGARFEPSGGRYDQSSARYEPSGGRFEPSGGRYESVPMRYRRHSSGSGGSCPAKGPAPGSWGSHSSHSSHSSGSPPGACTEEPTSSESEIAADGSSGGDPAELSQVIPRIIKPRKRRKKEKKPKIPRMAAAASEDRAGAGASGGQRWERRPSSLGTDTQSSSESALSVLGGGSGGGGAGGCGGGGGEWYLSSEQLESLCAELTAIRLRRQLTPPELTLTPPELAQEGWRQLGGLRRSRSEPTQRTPAPADERRAFSCPSSLLEFRESTPVNVPQPPQRPWLHLGRPSTTHSTCMFTVMCYNVLCEKYATRQMYGYCPNWALDWDYRKKSIMQEIQNYSADIITLQEVQTDQFYNFFLPTLQRDKYEGIFSPKSRAKTMAESEKKYVDGCAIFWRTEKFSLVKEYLIEFNQMAMANAEGSDDMLNRVMTKDNIGLAALLETRAAAWEGGGASDAAPPNQRLLVCTAHIHWDPEFCDVKLIQTMMLMHEIRQIMDREAASFRPGGGHRGGTGGGSNIQLLLCGDLNSLPDSGVVEFLVNGRVPANHPDFKELGYRTCLKKLSVSNERSGEFTHPFRLASSYSPDIMPYTNYTYDFKGIIDYIFYSRDTMSPLGILGPLDQDWLRENKVQGCPHPHVPSDHFSLLVELEMSPVRNDTANGLISAHR